MIHVEARGVVARSCSAINTLTRTESVLEIVCAQIPGPRALCTLHGSMCVCGCVHVCDSFLMFDLHSAFIDR